MKLKVKETFRDKYTGEVYEEGKIIDVKKERGEELLKSPYVVAEETKPSTKNNKNNTADNADKNETPENPEKAENAEKSEENNNQE